MSGIAQDTLGDVLDINLIKELIPHRYPMLLVDRIVDLVPGKQAVGIKNVTVNEPFFQGHFPGHPIVPGVLIVEAMAQTAGCLVMYSSGDSAKDSLVYFMSIEQARFRRPVGPGDQLKIHVVKLRQHRNAWKFHAVAKVDDKVCAEATYTAMLVDQTD